MAQQTVDSIRSLTNQYGSFCKLQDLLIQIKNSINNCYKMKTDTAMALTMDSIATSGSGRKECVNAQALLNFVFNDSFPQVFHPLIYGGNARHRKPNDSLPKWSNPAHIALFPNPATDKLNVSITGAKIGKGQAVMKIYTLLGKLQMKQQVTSGTNVISTKQLPAGVYMVNISIDDGLSGGVSQTGQVWQEKVVIER